MTEPEPTDVEAPIDAGASVVFHDSHRPALRDGRYRVEVHQTLNDGTNLHAFPAPLLSFTVAGPRFRLDPAEIHSVYPPPGATGSFAWTLPHVVLTRATLPWERSAASSGRDDSAPPWLALLLFRVDELAQRFDHVITVAEYMAGAPGIHGSVLDHDLATDLPNAPVRVLDVPAGKLALGLPDPALLPLLAHVRSVQPADGTASPVSETAIVVAGRVVQAGLQYEAHLVSLEGWLDVGTWWPHNRDDVIRVVSLHSWRFGADGVTSFKDEAGALSAGLLRRDLATNGASVNELASGWVSLQHERRDGGRGLAVYRGPLSPCESSDGQALTRLKRLPARRADELLDPAPDSKRVDVSLAAAWELGRLLSLQNPAVGLRLHQWWRQWCQHELRYVGRRQSPHLKHLRVQDPDPEVGDAFRSWLASEIWNLGAVPYRYLIADDAMLPKESLRLFTVDREWLACLADGVFSVACGSHLRVDREMQIALKANAMGAKVPERHGLLLRSRLLVDYPGLQVDASSQGRPCKPLRRSNLGPGILLLLYDQPVQRLVLHLPPQVMHFEVHEDDRQWVGTDGRPDFLSILKDPDGPAEEPTSGRLALRMLGVMPKVIFAELGS